MMTRLTAGHTLGYITGLKGRLPRQEFMPNPHLLLAAGSQNRRHLVIRATTELEDPWTSSEI